MIISKEVFRKPESYREVIEILGKEGILPKEFAERFAPSLGFRNILVHRYAEVDLDDSTGTFNLILKISTLFPNA